MSLPTLSFVSFFLFQLVQVSAEQHTIRFKNLCGHGTPTLVQAGKILSTGQDYTFSGVISSSIAYLQDGGCLLNGEGCGLVEMNMNNPPKGCIGCGPSADLSLIDPHKFNVPMGFQFYGGDGTCDGIGAFCASAGCDTAFYKPDDNQVQRACQVNDADLLITFCGPEATGYTDAVPGSLTNAASSSNGSPPSVVSIVAIAATTSTIVTAATPSPILNVGSAPSPSPSPALANGNGNADSNNNSSSSGSRNSRCRNNQRKRGTLPLSHVRARRSWEIRRV